LLILGIILPKPLRSPMQLKINSVWQKIPVRMILNWNAGEEEERAMGSAEEVATD
jgi:hypothetical protein